MAKEDLRVVKTKNSIKESFIELVEVKGYNRVSVTDIVKKANINRNTFYLHYNDKDDLVKKIIEESTKKIEASLAATNFLPNSSLSNIEEWQIRWGFRSILRLIKPDIELFRVVLLDSSLSGYFNQVYVLIKKYLSRLLNVTNPRSNLVYEYTFSGMMGLIQQWIIYSPTSVAQTAKILARLAYNDLQEFKAIN